MNKQINELLETINTATAEIARINNEDEPEPELLNGAVVCIDEGDGSQMTRHKKYVFKDGKTVQDNRKTTAEYKSIDVWNRTHCSKIARLIED